MNVGELKSLLEGLADDVEIRLMEQPNWPFEYNIENAVLVSELQGNLDGENGFKPDGYTCEEILDGEAEILYLVEGSQLGYGTKDAWQ